MSLFRGSNLEDVYNSFVRRVDSEVESLPPERVVGADIESLSLELTTKYHLDCPILGDDIEYDNPPFNPDLREVAVTVHIPFTGSSELFQHHGSNYPIINEQIDVHPNELVMAVRIQHHRLQELPQSVEGIKNRINDGLRSIADRLKHFDPNLKAEAARMLRERQHHFNSHASLLNQLKTVGFKLRRREDAKESVIVPVKPKVLQVQAKPTPAKPDPEPELSMSDYDAILQLIQNMVTVFERSPSAFKTMGEENLRTILLVALNGMFEGGATGETFNGEGKTDILIRIKDKNIFIAECLIWDGPEHFRKKLTEQLFKYATWRDSKLSAIVFNRKKGFSAVVEKMRETARGLENRVSEQPYPAGRGCRQTMRRADDPQKEFVLTCMAFEVPS